MKTNHKPKILVIEKTAGDLEIFKRFLQDKYHVTGASDFNMAWEHLLDSSFDGVITDPYIIKEDVQEYLNIIRESFYEGPVIALTDYLTGNFSVDRDKFLKAGYVDLITKPFDREKLFAALEKHVLNKK